MAKDHRRLTEEVAQGILLERPSLSQGDRREDATGVFGSRDDRARRRRTLRAHYRAQRAPQRPQAPHPKDDG